MHSFTPGRSCYSICIMKLPQKKQPLLKAALETDWSLREKYEVITSAQKSLEKLSLSPRKKAVDNILNYAEKVGKGTFNRGLIFHDCI